MHRTEAPIASTSIPPAPLHRFPNPDSRIPAPSHALHSPLRSRRRRHAEGDRRRPHRGSVRRDSARAQDRALAKVPPGLSEMDVTRLMKERAAQDGTPLNFAGAGAYEHHIPAAVWTIVSRGEFYSAYTPYQAEASQGTLQLIYEYQTMMTRLTQMDVSNASLYDGATALAEAVLMAERCMKKGARRVLVPRSVHPGVSEDAAHDRRAAGHRGRRVRFLPRRRQRRRRRSGLARAAGFRPVHRAGDSAAELLRRARACRRADRLGAREGRARDRRRQSGFARRAEAAGRMGQCALRQAGRRHRLRRRPAARRAAFVGWSVLRHPRAASRSSCARCRAASSAAPSISTGAKGSR